MNLFDSRYVNLRRDLDRLARERDPNRPNGEVAQSFEKALTRANLTRDAQGASAIQDELSQVLQSEGRWNTRSAMVGRFVSQPLNQANELQPTLHKKDAQSRQGPEHAGGQTSTGKEGVGQSRFAETRSETQPWSRRSVLQRDTDRPTGEESRFHAAKQRAAQPQPDPTPQKRSGKSPQQHEPQSHERPDNSLQQQSRQVLPRSFKRPDKPANRQSRAGGKQGQASTRQSKPADGSKQPQTRQALQGQQQQAQPDVRQGPGSLPHNTQRTRTPATGAERSANAPEEKGGLNARSANSDRQGAATRSRASLAKRSQGNSGSSAKAYTGGDGHQAQANPTSGLKTLRDGQRSLQSADSRPANTREFTVRSGSDGRDGGFDKDFAARTTLYRNTSAQTKGLLVAAQADDPAQGADFDPPVANSGQQHFQNSPDPGNPVTTNKSPRSSARNKVGGQASAQSATGPQQGNAVDMGAPDGNTAPELQSTQLQTRSLGVDGQSLLQEEDSDDNVALPLYSTLGFTQRPVPVTMGSDSSVERVTEARLGAAGSAQPRVFQTGAFNESDSLAKGVLASQTSGTKGLGSLSEQAQLEQARGEVAFAAASGSGSTTEQGTSVRSARDGAPAKPNAKASDLPEASGTPSSQLGKNEKDADSWNQTPVETPHIENPNAPSETTVLAHHIDEQSTTASRSTWHAIDELSSLMSNWERLSGTDREAHQLRVVSGIDGVAGIELRRDEQGHWLLTLQMEPGRPLMDPRARQDLMQRLEKRGHVLAELEEKEYLYRYRRPRED